MHIHCSPIVWNHPNSVSILLCLNGAIFYDDECGGGGGSDGGDEHEWKV